MELPPPNSISEVVNREVNAPCGENTSESGSSAGKLAAQLNEELLQQQSIRGA